MIENLAIDSGGINGLTYLGSLKYLYEKKLLDNLKRILGSSIGSLIGLLICLNFTIDDIIDLGLNINFSNILNMNNNFLEITTNFGYDNGNKLEKLIKSIIKSKMKKEEVTFKELYEYNPIELNVLVSNITDNKEEYFNKDNNPDMLVWEAVRISCNIPLIFHPYKLNDKYYTDGALNCCSSKYFNDPKKSLSMSISNLKDINNKIDTFYDYIKKLIYYPIKQIKSLNIDENNTLELSFKDKHNNDFPLNLEKEDKNILINHGYDKTKKNIDKILEYYNKKED